jgi:3-hydroxyisobutyrate dehydrogenase-like beta-hydroxyacid dehydrogenase
MDTMTYQRLSDGSGLPSVVGMNKIAFLGLGRMGLPIARRLVSQGHPVTVWNRDPKKAEGLNAAATPAEAVTGADVVITMLSDPEAVENVAARFVDALTPGTVWVDMSSVGPDSVAASTKAAPEGVQVVDSPVMGSVGPAASGELILLVGGEDEAVDKVLPVLKVLGRVDRAGGPGAGAALKLVLISAAIGGVAVVAEALALAERLGLDRELATNALGAGPLGGALKRLQSEDSDFPVRLAAKDLALAGGGPVLRSVRELLEAHPEIADDDLRHIAAAIR